MHSRFIAALLIILSVGTPAVALAEVSSEDEDGSTISRIIDGVAGVGASLWRGVESYGAQISLLAQEPVQQLPIPVLIGVEVSNLSQNFGDPRGGGTRSHEGLDIMAPRGTPVVSPTDAVVTRVGDGTNSGLTVSTTNPGGERFVYMHLDAIGEGVVAGKVLKPGDLIGYVGNTGNASGGAPHLHFEIRKDGALDPYPRLTRAFSESERSTYAAAIASTTAHTSAKALLDAYAPKPVTPAAATITATTATTNATSFARNLKRGMTGDDVRLLQIFLNGAGFAVASAGDGSKGMETTYFGPATERAVIAYQKARAIAPAAGYFGPLTRASVSAGAAVASI